MRKIICYIVIMSTLLLMGCGLSEEKERSAQLLREMQEENWMSQFTEEVKLYYEYDYASYEWDSRSSSYSKPDGWVVRYRGKFRGSGFDIYVQTYTLPDLTEDDYISLWYDSDNKYEYYVDFDNIDYDYKVLKHMSDPWYSYIMEDGVCTSNSEL